MYGEIAQLGILADEDQRKSGRKANLIASFGPAPGAFFADAFRLGRYRRVNLPVDLENRIQVILDKKAYSKAKIYDVAINGSGGWVIQFDRGKSFEMGGTIPVDLREALELGRKRNLSINVRNLIFSISSGTFCQSFSPTSRRDKQLTTYLAPFPKPPTSDGIFTSLLGRCSIRQAA